MWSLSTAKPGNGVEQLRDGNLETYWQSDGPQPHLVNIQFHKKTRVQVPTSPASTAFSARATNKSLTLWHPPS